MRGDCSDKLEFALTPYTFKSPGGPQDLMCDGGPGSRAAPDIPLRQSSCLAESNRAI